MSLVTYILSGMLALGLGLCTRSAVADVVAVVSAKSAITALSKSALTDIFLGKASRFPNGTQAVPIDQGEGTAVRDEFYATFTGKTAAQMKAYWSKIIFTGRGLPPRVLSNSKDLKQLLTEDPRAIGYIERSAVDSSIKVLNPP
jgi:ABC-type phosphate transport system substrate-binding protein